MATEVQRGLPPAEHATKHRIDVPELALD